MKKIICLILIFTLLLSLSISVFAVGNSYSFTSTWWQACFNQSLVFSNNVEKKSTVYVGKASVDGYLYNSDEQYNSSLVWVESQYIPSGTTNVVIPLNLLLHSSYEYLDLEFLIAYEGDVTVNSATVQIGNSNYSTDIDVTSFDLLEFGNISFPTASATQATFVPSYSGKGYRVGVRYVKNISSIQQTIDSVTLNLTTGSTSLAVGAPCNNNTVVLPDSFYDAIYTVKLVTRLVYNNIVDINENISSIQSQLDDILSAIGDSGSSTENYYNTIINQSPEQAAVVAQLQSDLAAAKEELAEIQEVITSVPAPSADNIFNTDTSTSSEDYISDALSDNTVLDLFTYFFNNSFVIMAFGVTITIATVSYILYGKKG